MKEIWVDGSCRGNPGPGGWGVIVLEDGKITDVTYGCAYDTTNNRMEMTAILWAMANYGSSFINIPIVYTDSDYCVNSFTNWITNWKKNGWTRTGGKPIENIDLIKEYDRLDSYGRQIDLRKVKGHNGIQWNEVADKLARGKIRPEEVKVKYGG